MLKDLRRPPPWVGRLQTTAKYAHASDEVSRDIAWRMGEAIERSTREGAERLRQERAEGEATADVVPIEERQQRAVGDDQGENDDQGEGAEVVPLDGKVIRFPGSRRR